MHDDQPNSTNRYPPAGNKTYNHDRYGGCGGTGPRPVRVAPWRARAARVRSAADAVFGRAARVSTRGSVVVTRPARQLQIESKFYCKTRHLTRFIGAHLGGASLHGRASLQTSPSAEGTSRVARAWDGSGARAQHPPSKDPGRAGFCTQSLDVFMSSSTYTAPPHIVTFLCLTYECSLPPTPCLSPFVAACHPLPSHPPFRPQSTSWAPPSSHHERQPERADPRDD